MKMNEAEELSKKYFNELGAADELRSIYRCVVKYKTDRENFGRGTARRATLGRAATHAAALCRLLNQIEITTLIKLMGPTTYGNTILSDIAPGENAAEVFGDDRAAEFLVETRSSCLPLRHSQLNDFIETLKTVGQALRSAAEQTEVTMGRPPLPDALSMGIEDLIKLWTDKRGRPTHSRKRGSFHELARELFCKHCGFDRAQVSTKVRRILEGGSRGGPANAD